MFESLINLKLWVQSLRKGMGSFSPVLAIAKDQIFFLLHLRFKHFKWTMRAFTATLGYERAV